MNRGTLGPLHSAWHTEGTRYVFDERMNKCYTSLPVLTNDRRMIHGPYSKMCSMRTNEHSKSICFPPTATYLAASEVGGIVSFGIDLEVQD